jgi:hypothetical protein
MLQGPYGRVHHQEGRPESRSLLGGRCTKWTGVYLGLEMRIGFDRESRKHYVRHPDR